jgi:hypothetical protein
LVTGGSSLADPVASQKSFEEGFNSKSNLFDGFQDFDLSNLIGQGIIIPFDH